MILTARYVFSAEGPLIEHGAIRVDSGRIAWVGRHDALSGSDAASHEVVDLGDALVTPGLVNAHAHLELSALAGRLKPSGLWTWLARLVRLRREVGRSEARVAARGAAEEALTCGVTCIADISRKGDSWRELVDLPMRKVCFAELISIARDSPRTPAELEECVEAAIREAGERSGLAFGISPHASYTVSEEHLRGSAELARRRGWPLTTHWSETKEECRWLARGGGRLGALLWTLGAGGKIGSPRSSAMRYAERTGLLDVSPLLAHVNYVSDEDLSSLAGSGASVVYCPRSHRFFGHKGHRWREMLDAGVTVCVGTDSLASLPPGARLSVLDELAMLREEAPEVSPATLWRMGTIHGACGLGMADRTGSLSVGKLADLVAWPVSDRLKGDPLADVLANRPEPLGVWVGGEQVAGC